jgi:hypothetical protein
MWPLIAAAAAKVAGPIVGGYGNSQDISTGMAGYQNDVNAGTDVLNQGKADASAAYSPYTANGVTGTNGLAASIQDRQQATGPALSNTSPDSVDAYLNPSAAYSTDMANKSIQAQAIASGGAGGGMLKALSNNANQMGMTNYNSAYQQMLDTNNQNFGQQQQQYTNNNDFQQQQIGNYAGLAGQGLSATGANQQLQSGYNDGINKNWNNIATNEQSAWDALGKNFNDTSVATGNNISGGISDIFKSGGST